MKIKFLKNTTLSHDGVYTRVYFAGQVYEPYHAQERRVFEQALKSGEALPVDVDGETIEIKVAPPIEKKAEPIVEKKVIKKSK
jgi:tartrate dehydratase beta subunit/fumarate hydratase class I family protein